jgi:hypothetical protein
MTPKEKAEDIVRKYSTYVVMWTGGVETERQNVKQCALIAVDEILSLFISECEDTKYWQQVKQEIEKL